MALVENASDLCALGGGRRRPPAPYRRQSSLMSYDPSDLEPEVRVEEHSLNDNDSVDGSLYSVPHSVASLSTTKSRGGGHGGGRCYQSSIASRSFKAFAAASSVRRASATGATPSVSSTHHTKGKGGEAHHQRSHNVRTEDLRTIIDAVSDVLEKQSGPSSAVLVSSGAKEKEKSPFTKEGEGARRYISDVSFKPKGCRWKAKVVVLPEGHNRKSRGNNASSHDEELASMMSSHLNVRDDNTNNSAPLEFRMQLTCSAVMAAESRSSSSLSSRISRRGSLDLRRHDRDDDDESICTLGTVGVDTVYEVDAHLLPLDGEENPASSSSFGTSTSSASSGEHGEREPMTEREKLIRNVFEEISLDVKKALVRTELPEFPEGCKGKTFREVYQLNKKLKSGSLGTVCRATHRATGKKVAVKCVLRNKLEPTDDAAIYDEVLVMASLQHRYICPLLDFFVEDECYFLVMELMTGGDLFDRIGQKRSYSERDARDLCIKMLDAVGFCHEHNIAHNDIKPKNLLLISDNDDSHIKLADFGFASRVYAPKSLTKQCGTPFFVAPEILLREKYDTAADMWSVGVAIYLLLSGDFPFTASTQRNLFRKIVKCQYDFPHEKWQHVSDEAKDLIRKLLVVDPDRRYTAKQAMNSAWIQRTRGKDLAKNQLTSQRNKLATLSSFMKKQKSDRAMAG